MKKFSRYEKKMCNRYDKNYLTMLISMQEVEENKKKRYYAKLDEQNTPEYKQNKAKREGWQNEYLKKEDERIKASELLVKLKAHLVKSILADLNLENKRQYDLVLDMETVKRVMNKYQPEIDYLKENCLSYEKPKTTSKHYQYTLLYRDLMDVNPIFIEFAPVETFYTTETADLISRVVFAKYKKSFEDRHFFEDEKFMQANAKYLRGVTNISTITNYDVARRELKASPELYPELSTAVRSVLFSNTKPMQDLIRMVPQVLKYMSQEDLEYSSDLTPVFGQAIVKCPDVLENFPKDFFVKHSAERMFRNCSIPKCTIYEAIIDHASDFEGLNNYLAKYAPKKHNQTADANVGI